MQNKLNFSFAMSSMKKVWMGAVVAALFLSLLPLEVAARGDVLGIHILAPGEVDAAAQLLRPAGSAAQGQIVTIPLSLADLDKPDQWRQFFITCAALNLRPVVRLTTKFENGAWQVPTYKNIVDLMTFLERMPWPEGERYIIAFNEPNHAPEWGGVVDPESYAKSLTFTVNWTQSLAANFKVLPGAVDLAAGNTAKTMDAWDFLNRAYAAEPDTFAKLDYWNSHSYPNPAFSAPPTATGRNSLRGFEHELAWLKEKTGRDLQVFITETGWEENAATANRLANYYNYAVDNIWQDGRIKGVSPFILQGAPGPFAKFSFLDASGQPTRQYKIYQQQLLRLAAAN